jgi:membrane dipeptidase
MEALGITVDVSHLNETGFWQVTRQARRPIIATHAASAAVCPHPRNLTDDQFLAIRERGGLVGLSLYPEHLGGADFDIIRRHLEHFLSLGGERMVCFGADFDGMTAPSQWNGIAVMEQVKQYLESCGWSAHLLDAVFYTNALTFFSAGDGRKSVRNEE